jgi:acetyl esterase/lipase
MAWKIKQMRLNISRKINKRQNSKFLRIQVKINTKTGVIHMLKFSKLTLAIACSFIVVTSFADDKEAPTPTFKDIKYGPEERQVLDFWKADNKKPTPVLVLIHGGGWIHGNKEGMAKSKRQLIKIMLKKGVSVAAINYRLSPQYKLPIPVYDAARAIQFLRYKAKDYNIDKKHIAATGGSAGGCTSLWLATHDDKADPSSQDPVLRESTRLCGALVGDAQTTIDPKQLREWDNEGALKHCMIKFATGFKSNEEMMKNYASAKALFDEFSPVKHLDANDPPIVLKYSGAGAMDQKGNIHHAKFGLNFKKKADEVGAKCILQLKKHSKYYPEKPGTKDFLLEVLEAK